MPMPAAYLDNLNTAQRGAVEHGVFDQVGPFWSLLAQGPGRRILWRMTFSRRAAAKWRSGLNGSRARPWDEFGLNPAFTIHDREDSADLMNLATFAHWRNL